MKTDKDFRTSYEQMGAWGILTSVDIHNCNPEKIRDAAVIRDFVIQLCDRIKMKRFGEPQIIHFGEDESVAGFSMTQLIETSLISAHFANLTNNVYLDIFSCKYYDPIEIVEFSKQFFDGKSATHNVLLRK